METGRKECVEGIKNNLIWLKDDIVEDDSESLAFRAEVEKIIEVANKWLGSLHFRHV